MPPSQHRTSGSSRASVSVEYYLIQLVDEVASPEGREKQWVSPPEAFHHLAFEDAKNLLRVGLPEIEARAVRQSMDARFDEFLLHEFDHLGASLLANEEGGEIYGGLHLRISSTSTEILVSSRLRVFAFRDRHDSTLRYR